MPNNLSFQDELATILADCSASVKSECADPDVDGTIEKSLQECEVASTDYW